MENKNYESMKVAELREESRKRGLTLEYKGHKFTKAELIERLISDEERSEMWDSQDQDNETEEVKVETEQKEVECEKFESSDPISDRIIFATTLEEIEKKYSTRKPQKIYDNELKPGCFVVYMRYIETRSGVLLKKLGTAKVVGVNRKKEIVRVETPVGELKEIGFYDLLYIRSINENRYPRDINEMLWKQRNEYKNRMAGVNNEGERS